MEIELRKILQYCFGQAPLLLNNFPWFPIAFWAKWKLLSQPSTQGLSSLYLIQLNRSAHYLLSPTQNGYPIPLQTLAHSLAHSPCLAGPQNCWLLRPALPDMAHPGLLA